MFSDNTATDAVSPLINFYQQGWEMEYERGVEKQTIIDSQREIIREQARLIEAQARALQIDDRRTVILKYGEAQNDD